MNAIALPASGSEAIPFPAGSMPTPATALYVSPDFDAWETDRPACWARDVTVNGTAYRALDPEYYAWLRHRMTLAMEAYLAGDMTCARFEESREAFNGVHAWAMQRFSECDLLRALDRLRPKHYDSPRAFTGARSLSGGGTVADTGHAAVPASPCAKAVSPRAVAQVDAIQDEAFALGWSHASLYATRGRYAFPCGQDYGLVCFLDAGDRVGSVTREYIELVRAGRADPLRFYRTTEAEDIASAVPTPHPP